MPEVDFGGQVAIITGAGSGIGRATALLLAARGAKVLVNDCGSWPGTPDPVPRAEAVVREIRGARGHAIAEFSMVGTRESAERIAAAALRAFGRIDVLINNAGISRPGAFGETSDADVDHVLAVNLLGPLALMRCVWQVMRDQRYGRILNLSSSAALGSGISAPYATSKGGLLSLTKDAGIAGRPLGILVNALLPCAHTPLLDHHPDPAYREWMRSHLPPDKVAAAAAFLVSRDMSLGGEIFTAGGGRVSRLAFIESAGCFERDLTPELVREHFEAICDLSAGRVLITQADHERSYAELFPDGAPSR